MGLAKANLSDQIYEMLREDIVHQRIKCGEKMTVKMLVERFQVSATPVREALVRLAQEKLVTYHPNAGASVIELTDNDIRELYEFEGDVDSLAIYYASRHPDNEELIEKLKENLKKSRELIGVENADMWNASTDEFHMLFLDYCQNSRLMEAAERVRSQLGIVSNQCGNFLSLQEQICRFHEEIFEAYERGDVQAAMDLMKQHMSESLIEEQRLLREEEK